MQKFLTAAMLLGFMGLTACATVEQPAVLADAAPAADSKPAYAVAPTGSRIPSKRTGQTLGSTNGADYDRDMRGIATPFEKK
ncbi:MULTISPECIES: hypothetical protein [unclassified Duganella]|uniref:hypothetical protein n=1 Tax=unclassified Duganella TaxID=2636909 RepID=UPI000E3462FC|nr:MULTISPECIES: hypothetical protein [unclassified Duganella]RFP11292.1 hypothetical protein D0T23_20440 [Duganella sp. BJB475]RFP29611.1 hypothetical protein D0T21_17195 [Duganella sp. BJB476]